MLASRHLVRLGLFSSVTVTGLACWLSYSSSHHLPPSAHADHTPLSVGVAEPTPIAAAESVLLSRHAREATVRRFPVSIAPHDSPQLMRLLPSGQDSLMIHTLSATKPSHRQKPVLVLVHGWSAGSALWARSLDSLAEHFDVYAFDLLGFGQSSRPRFLGSTPEDARDFWLQSFELWRRQTLPEGRSFSLLGHSLVCQSPISILLLLLLLLLLFSFSFHRN